MVVMAGALSPPPISPLSSSSLVDSSFPLLGIFSCQMVSFLAFGCRIWSWRLIFRSTSKEFYLSRYYLAYPIWRSLYILLATVGYILVRVLVDLFSCEIITALSVSLYTSLYTQNARFNTWYLFSSKWWTLALDDKFLLRSYFLCLFSFVVWTHMSWITVLWFAVCMDSLSSREGSPCSCLQIIICCLDCPSSLKSFSCPPLLSLCLADLGFNCTIQLNFISLAKGYL